MDFYLKKNEFYKLLENRGKFTPNVGNKLFQKQYCNK